MKGYKKKGISIEEWNERRGRNMKGYKKKGISIEEWNERKGIVRKE